MKILEVLILGAGAVLGAILGAWAFGAFYPPLKAGLGLGIAVPAGSTGEGFIVPVGEIVGPYRMAGSAIDLIVLIASIIAGMYAVTGIIRAFRK